MPLPNVIRSTDGVPVSQQYVPSLTANVALKGSPNTTTDSNGTVSAAALALDQSLSLSATLQNAQAGNANGTVLSMLGMASVVFTVNMSGYTGTVNFEGSEDGTNFDPLLVWQLGTTTLGTTVTGSVTTSIHLYEASCANLQSIRARTSGASAGNVTVTAHAIAQPIAPRMVHANLATIAGIATQMASADALTAANVQLIAEGQYNGATLERRRGNVDTGALINASGATTTQTTADQINYNGRGLVVVLNTTVIGTGSITLTIQGKDTASGQYYTLLSGSTVITNTTNIYTVYPGLTAAANVTANNILPRTWRIQVTANNVNAATYTVGASIIA